MNQAAVQKNKFSVRKEMQSAAAFAATDRRERVVCPKPRRAGLINTTPFRQRFDSSAADDGLDLLCFKGGCELDNFSCINMQLASPSPLLPFLYGSPPCRVANPLIQDVRFGDEKLLLISPVVGPPLPSPPHSTGRKVGFNQSNCGNNLVVRIEGFDCCLDMERPNRNIPTLA